MNQNLQELRSKFTQLQQLATLDIHNWDPATKPGMEGRKNKAVSELEELSPKLVRAILTNSKAYLVTRDYEKTGEIIQEAAKNADTTIVLDFLSVEKNMFNQIFDKKVTTFTFNSDVVNKMNVLLFDVGNRLDVLSMPSVDTDARRFGTLRSREEMIERMEEALITAFNDELKRSIIQLDLKEQVLKKLGLDSVTVVVINVLPQFAGSLKGLAGKVTMLSNDNPQLANLAATKTKKATPKETTAETTKTAAQPLPPGQNYPGKRRGPKPKNRAPVTEAAPAPVTSEEPTIRQITAEDTQNSVDSELES